MSDLLYLEIDVGYSGRRSRSQSNQGTTANSKSEHQSANDIKNNIKKHLNILINS